VTPAQLAALPPEDLVDLVRRVLRDPVARS
jgi:hypothetical protein